MSSNLRYFNGSQCVAFPCKRNSLYHRKEEKHSLWLVQTRTALVLIGGVCRLFSAGWRDSRRMPHVGIITSLLKHTLFAWYSISNSYSLVLTNRTDESMLKRTISRDFSLLVFLYIKEPYQISPKPKTITSCRRLWKLYLILPANTDMKCGCHRSWTASPPKNNF